MSLIDEIKQSVTIEAALEHFGVEVPPRGRDPVMVRCPWHDERNPSMAVYRKRGRAWCYSCQKGGDVIDVTAIFLTRGIKEAVTYWADRLGLSRRIPTAEEVAEARRARERQRLRMVCHSWSQLVERGMPRPRDPDLLSIWDAAHRAKDGLDEFLLRDGGVKTRAQALAYMRQTLKWRKRWEPLLEEANGDAWREEGHHGNTTSRTS